MVCYLSETGMGIEHYAETDSGILDLAQETYNQFIEYAEPEKVHPSALLPNTLVRQQGYWVKPETMPKRYLWANGAKDIPDVLPGFVVSSRFRDLVERFEPSVHQFIPVEVFKERNSQPVVTYYWFVVGQRIDGVDRNMTTFVLERGQREIWVDSVMDTQSWEFAKIPDAKLFFSNQRVRGRHIWHDPHILSFNNGLCSDVFAEAISSSGLTGVAATPRESV